MKALASFLLIPASIAVYVALATRFAIYQRYPVAHYLVIACALLLLAILLVRGVNWWRLLLNGGGWVLAIFFGWWTLAYSTYETPAPEAALAGVQHSTVLELVQSDETGSALPLRDRFGGNRAILLAFYRGYW